MAGTITSANSVIMLGVAGLFPVAQQLQGYAAEDIFETDDVEPAEISLGLDGKQSAGWVPFNVPQRFTLQANSDSIAFFEQWVQAQNIVREVMTAFGIVSLPAIGKKYSLNNGILSRAKPITDARKTLQPVAFQITWESVVPAPV